VYDVFPSIESKLHTRAATLEIDRFIGFLNHFEFKPDSNRLKSSIQANLEQHKRFLDSLNLLAVNTEPELLKKALDAYSEKLPAGAQRTIS